MKTETKQQLLACDEEGHWEFPSQSSPGVTIEEIEALLPTLERIFGNKLDVDRNVQDASFLTDVGVLDERYYNRERGCGAISYLYSFRFSNFGRLFTVFGSAIDDPLLANAINEAKTVLVKNGFCFIEADELHELYDGKNRPFDDRLTWWIRFFDYL